MDTTERLHFSLLCIGEGNGNPLQCSCLENPRDRGARWAAVYGVAQSRTRLTQLSSSSSSLVLGFPGGASSREPACQCRRHKRCGFDPWVRKISWRRAWQPTPVFWPGEFHELYSLWGRKELDMTERLSLCFPVFLPRESHEQRSLEDYSPWGLSSKNTGVGCHFLLQGIFLTQGSNLHLLCLLQWEVNSLSLAPHVYLVINA